jgi:hypothetical protein
MNARDQATPKRRRWRRARRIGAAATLACYASVLCGAGPPSSGLEGFGRVVDDDELADMRGKFVAPSGVHFFGIQMLQTWQGPDGVTLQATLEFNVDFAGSAATAAGATPRLQVGWSRACDSCGDPTMDVHSPAMPGQDGPVTLTQASDALPLGDYVTVNGLVQSQQIAGSDNNVRNVMRVSVVPASATSQGSDGGGSDLDTSATHVLANGDAIHFIVAKNELGMAITRGDSLVRAGVGGPASQAAQEVILQSSFNAIRNDIGITLGVDDVRQFDRLGVSGAMSAMKGRGL